MWLGVLEAGWLLVESVIESLLFKFSRCANRGLMALKRSPFQPGRSEPGKSENWGRPSGGTDFLIARTGGDFNVPIRKAAWRDRQIYFMETIWLNGKKMRRNIKPQKMAVTQTCKPIENNYSRRMAKKSAAKLAELGVARHADPTPH